MTNDIEKLEAQLPNFKGKEQIRILINLTTAYRYKDPQKTLEYGKQTLELLHIFPNKKQEMFILNQLSLAYQIMGNYVASEHYARNSLSIAKQINDKIGEANAIYSLGRTFLSQGQYQKVKINYNHAIKIYHEVRDKNGIANSYQLISNAYFKIGDFSLAIEYAFKALDIFVKKSNLKGIADTKNLCGIIYSASGDYQIGLNYLHDAHQRYKNLDDLAGVARSLNNIGFTYSTMGQPLKSIEYFKKSLTISLEVGSNDLLSTVLTSLGETYSQLKDYPHAMDFFSKSLKLVQEANDSTGISYILIQIGKLKRQTGFYKSALSVLKQALAIAQKINIKNEIKSSNKELYEVYKILGDYSLAVHHYKEYMNIDGDIFIEKNRKRLIEMKIRYEPEQREKELSLLKKDQELQQLELSQQENIRSFSLSVVLILLFLALVIYTGYRLKAKSTLTLTQEIMEHKQTAKKLLNSEGKFRILAEKSMVGMCIIQNNKICYANPVFLSIFGYSYKEVLGLSFSDLLIESDRARINSQGINSSGFEFQGLTKEGKKPYLHSFPSVTQYQGKVAILETIIDITEQKKIEAELQKMRKLESVGVLAGTIAQDFYQILLRISTEVERLNQFIPDSPDIQKMAENLKKTSIKGTELAKKLITFSKGGNSFYRKISIESIFNNLSDIYTQLKLEKHNIYIPPNLHPTYGDEGELSQVISNLLWNAWEAKSENNSIIIKINAQNKRISSGNNVSLNPGNYIEINISDNGKGIHPEQLDKVFDPYFSTKETYHQKGMGLGLAICYSIIKKHNGHISIRSEIGAGTTVSLFLPAANETKLQHA